MANRRMLEREYEDYLWDNSRAHFPGCRAIGRQVHFTWATGRNYRRKIIIDILLRELSNNAFVVVEVKAIKATEWTYNNQIVDYAKKACFEEWRGIVAAPLFSDNLLAIADDPESKLSLITINEEVLAHG